MQPLRPGGTEKKNNKKSQCIGSWYVTIFEIGKCKLKILFFQFSFFNYFIRSLKDNFLLSLRAPKTRSVEGAKQSVMFKRLLYRNDTCKHFLDSAPRACWISMHCQQCLTRLKFFYSVKNKKGLTEKKKNSVRLEEWL